VSDNNDNVPGTTVPPSGGEPQEVKIKLPTGEEITVDKLLNNYKEMQASTTKAHQAKAEAERKLKSVEPMVAQTEELLDYYQKHPEEYERVLSEIQKDVYGDDAEPKTKEAKMPQNQTLEGIKAAAERDPELMAKVEEAIAQTEYLQKKLAEQELRTSTEQIQKLYGVDAEYVEKTLIPIAKDIRIQGKTVYDRLEMAHKMSQYDNEKKARADLENKVNSEKIGMNLVWQLGEGGQQLVTPGDTMDKLVTGAVGSNLNPIFNL
jgi:hypothetical protein